MADTEVGTLYALEVVQNEEIVALARQRNEAPQKLVREAVAKYLVDAEYDNQRKTALAALKHPHRDNVMLGAWRGTDIDGVIYQSTLRSE
jgi:hypothetical protein